MTRPFSAPFWSTKPFREGRLPIEHYRYLIRRQRRKFLRGTTFRWIARYCSLEEAKWVWEHHFPTDEQCAEFLKSLGRGEDPGFDVEFNLRTTCRRRHGVVTAS